MKKGLKKLAVILAAFSLTGCQNDIEPAPDITSSIEGSTKSEVSEAVESTDISTSIGEEVVTDSGEKDFIPKLLMETDKPFVLAEERYLIEKQEVDVSVLNEYGYISCVADGKYYYAEHTLEKNNNNIEMVPFEEASICVYDSESGEYSLLYSETPSGDFNVLVFDIVGLHNNFLYYFREESRYGSQSSISEGLDLCRLNLENKKSEHIFSLNNRYWFGRKDNITIVGNSVFFCDFFDIDLETDEYIRVIYCFDLNTSEVSVFREDAENVIPYKDGIIYYHDGGYFYHGEAVDIKDKGIFYEGDKLIFYTNSDGEPEITEINVKGDTVIYRYSDTVKAIKVMGIFDDEFNRIEIASTKRDTWYIGECIISEVGLVSVGGAPKPLIYDPENECFAVISIDDYSDYRSYATENGICFFGYDEDDNDYRKFASAALYTVKRR